MSFKRAVDRFAPNGGTTFKGRILTGGESKDKSEGSATAETMIKVMSAREKHGQVATSSTRPLIKGYFLVNARAGGQRRRASAYTLTRETAVVEKTAYTLTRRGRRRQKIMRSVPPAMSNRPTPALSESFSLNTRKEKETVSRILSLSMGTTTLAGPSCNAR